MADEKSDDRAGTFWDWPTGWILAGVVILLAGVFTGDMTYAGLAWVLILFGAISTAIRRGAFTSRKRG